MSRLVDQYIARVEKEMPLSEIDVVKIRYVIAALTGDLTKMLIIGTAFTLLDMLIPFFFTVACIIPVRLASGGLHFNTYTKCLLASFTYFILCVLILPLLPMAAIVNQLLLLVSVAVIWVAPLAPSRKRPIISKKKYFFNKWLSVILSSLSAIVLLFFISDDHLVSCGVWAFVLQALQLFFMYILNITRRTHDV